MIQKNKPFTPRVPIATMFMGLVLVAIFSIEHHPHIGLSQYRYLSLSLSSWGINQLYGELTLLAVGGVISEQFLKRWKLLLYLIIVGPVTIWFAEYTHANTIVAGLSGATTGLIGFGVLALIWWYFERPESLWLELVSSAIISYAAIVGFTALYGVLVRAGVSIVPLGMYNSGTMYDDHVAGFIIGFVFWIYEHHVNNTA